MGKRAIAPRLSDIVLAIERIRATLKGVSLESYEADWQLQWIVERGVAIISEASRHLPTELKDRHPDIPWKQIAGVGNIVRHDYGDVSAPILWTLAQSDLSAFETICRDELEIATRDEGFDDDGLGGA